MPNQKSSGLQFSPSSILLTHNSSTVYFQVLILVSIFGISLSLVPFAIVTSWIALGRREAAKMLLSQYAVYIVAVDKHEWRSFPHFLATYIIAMAT